MTVSDLIKALQAMPQDAEVRHLWDGAGRTAIDHVWLARGGHVMTSENGMACYYDEDRPHGAPSEAEDGLWKPS